MYLGYLWRGITVMSKVDHTDDVCDKKFLYTALLPWGPQLHDSSVSTFFL